jgi:hypothetical protein
MLQPDYRDMLLCLSDAECEYLVVGAYAMAVHGYPRATGDIDIWVRPSAANEARVLAALTAFGAPTGHLTAGDLSVPGNVIQLGVAPCRIDILTHIDGVTFVEAHADRVIRDVDGLQVPFLSRDLLNKNKSSTGRLQDQADVEVLKRTPD